MSISDAQSEFVLNAACTEAEAIGVPMNVAILDDASHLKLFMRMDDALLGSIDIALKKAKTAALFNMASDAVGEFCKPGGTSPGLEATNGGLVVFAGGAPLRAEDGHLLGAIGVSGGSVAQDQQVALAGARALKNIPANGDSKWETHGHAGRSQQA